MSGRSNSGPALPETETLTFVTPPDWEPNYFRQALADAVHETETQSRPGSIKTQSHGPPTHPGPTLEPRPHNPRRPPRKQPRVAGRDKWRRIEALARNKQFIEAYKAAMDRYRQGEEAIFPPGTWHMVQFHSMPVASGDVDPSGLAAIPHHARLPGVVHHETAPPGPPRLHGTPSPPTSQLLPSHPSALGQTQKQRTPSKRSLGPGFSWAGARAGILGVNRGRDKIIALRPEFN